MSNHTYGSRSQATGLSDFAAQSMRLTISTLPSLELVEVYVVVTSLSGTQTTYPLTSTGTFNYANAKALSLYIQPIYNDGYAAGSMVGSIQSLNSGGSTLGTVSVNQSIDALQSANFAKDDVGTAGADTLVGDNNSNRLVGLGGDDVLRGSAGADRLDGGTGSDTADYSLSSAAVQVAIGVSASGGDAQGDTLVGIENVWGSAFADTLSGDGGDNRLEGNGGNDTLNGNAGADILVGGAGDDLLNGGTGADEMAGRGDNDTYIVDNAGDMVYEDAGGGTNDLVQTTLASYTLASEVEALQFIGTGNFSGTGNTLANSITGGSGNDTLSGGGGNDILNGGTGADALTGGSGDDIYIVDNAGDTVSESAGGGTNDLVQTTLASYTLGSQVEALQYSGAGNFTGTGNTLANSITSGGGNDILSGGAGNDVLSGGLGGDILNGGADDDTLTGGGGNDALDGGSGDDAMAGGAGDDVYIIDSAGDTVTEGAGGGTDEVWVDLYAYTLGANVENLLYLGFDYIEVTGNALANTITLGSVEDTASGGDGNDTIYGLEGDDVLYGEGGNDVLVGGFGADSLIGGSGADIFVFSNEDLGTVTGADYIWDFSHGSDKIDLSLMDADANVAGDQAFSFIGAAAFSGTAGELRYYSSGGDNWIQVDIDGDGVADFDLILVGAPAPVVTDFTL